MLHIDIFSTDKKYFLTVIDKFSKFAVVYLENRRRQSANNTANEHFPNTKTIYCDNEASFNSETITFFIEN